MGLAGWRRHSISIVVEVRLRVLSRFPGHMLPALGSCLCLYALTWPPLPDSLLPYLRHFVFLHPCTPCHSVPSAPSTSPPFLISPTIPACSCGPEQQPHGGA